MPKLTDVTKLVPATTTPASGNFFQQATGFVKQLSDALKLAQTLQNTGGPPPSENRPPARVQATPPSLEPPPPSLEPPPPAPPLVNPVVVFKAGAAFYLEALQKSGMGGKTVDELLKLAGPFTIDQLREALK